MHAPIKDGGQGGGSTFVDGFEGDSLAGQGLHEDACPHRSI